MELSTKDARSVLSSVDELLSAQAFGHLFVVSTNRSFRLRKNRLSRTLDGALGPLQGGGQKHRKTNES